MQCVREDGADRAGAGNDDSRCARCLPMTFQASAGNAKQFNQACVV